MKETRTTFHWKCNCCKRWGRHREDLATARRYGRNHIWNTKVSDHPQGHNVVIVMIKEGSEHTLGPLELSDE